MDQIEADLSAAVMGDEDAIRRIATRLRAGSPDGDPAERERFMDAVAEFRSEYRDLCNNAADYATLVEVDARIAREQPELDYSTRLRIAGNAVRSGEFSTLTEEADRSMAIEQMRTSRKGRELPPREGRARSEYPAAFQGGREDDDNQTAIARMRVHGRYVQARGRE